MDRHRRRHHDDALDQRPDLRHAHHHQSLPALLRLHHGFHRGAAEPTPR